MPTNPLPTSITVQDNVYGPQPVANVAWNGLQSEIDLGSGAEVNAGDQLAISVPGYSLSGGNYQAAAWNSVSSTPITYDLTVSGGASAPSTAGLSGASYDFYLFTAGASSSSSDSVSIVVPAGFDASQAQVALQNEDTGQTLQGTTAYDATNSTLTFTLNSGQSVPTDSDLMLTVSNLTNSITSGSNVFLITMFGQASFSETVQLNPGTQVTQDGSATWINNGTTNPLSFQFTPQSSTVSGTVYIQPTSAPSLSSGITAIVAGQNVSGAWSSSDSLYEIPGVDLQRGTPLSVTLDGSTVPATPGQYGFNVWTSTDTGPVSITLTVGSVQNLTAGATNPVQGEFSGFTASFEPQSAIPAQGTITVSGLPVGIPSGSFPSDDVQVTAANATVSTGAPSVDMTGDLTIPVQSGISAGSQVTVQVGVYSDLQIPVTGSNSGGIINVSTSSDTTAASSQFFSLATSGGTQVTGASVTPYTTGASTQTYPVYSPYTVAFTPTTTVQGGVDAIHVTGMDFGTSTPPEVTLTSQGSPVSTDYIGLMNGTLTVVPASSLQAGTPVSVVVGGLDGNASFDPSNPSTAGSGFSISTDADASPVTVAPFTPKATMQVFGTVWGAQAGHDATLSVNMLAPSAGSTVTIDLSKSDTTWNGSPSSNPPLLATGTSETQTALAAGTYSLTGNVLTIDSTAFSGIPQGQQVSFSLPVVNGTAGRGYVSVQTSDTSALNWFGYNIVPTPTLAASDTTPGATDTLSLQFEISQAQEYIQGSTDALTFDVSSLTNAGVQMPTTGQLQVGGGAPQAVTLNTTSGQMSMIIPVTMLAGQVDTLSFSITNPSFMAGSITDVTSGSSSNTVQVGTPNLSGTVEDASGAAVPDATVNLVDITKDAPTDVVADGTGAFSTQLGSDTYVITGYYSPQDNLTYNLLSPITVTPSQTPALGLTVKASAPNVTGQLTTPAGTSDAGVMIRASNGQIDDSLQTSSTGAISGTLPPGTWSIYELDGSTSSVEMNPAQSLVVPSSGTVTLDITWPNANAFFTLTQGGSPAQNAYLVVAPYANGQADLTQEIWFGPTDQNGNTDTTLSSGTYEVVGAQIGSVYADLTSAAQTFSAPTSATVQIAAPAPNLNLTLNPNGLQAPLGYAHVEVAPDNGSGQPDTAKAQWLQADQNGDVSALVPSTPTTWYVLEMETSDLADTADFSAAPIPVTLGTQATTIDWPAFTVTVETNAGTPVANDQLTIAPQSGDGMWFNPTTSSTGTFTFDEAAGSQWEIVQYGDVSLWQSPVTFTIPTTGSALTVKVPSPTLQGTVSDSSGQLVPGAWLSFAPLVSGSVDWAQQVGAQADSSGSYGAILGAGKWQAVGFWNPQTSNWVDLSQDGITQTVVSGQTATLDVKEPSPNFSGTVTRAGQPMADAQIILFSSSGSGIDVQTDGSGNFSTYLPASQTWTPAYLISQGGAQLYLGSEPPLTLPATIVSFTWPTPNVSGQVTAGGQGVAQAVVYFAPAAGLIDPGTWQLAVADDSGNYSINLASGQWTAVGVWTGTEYVSLQDSITASSIAQTVNVSVGGVSLKIENAAGQAVPDAIVEVQPSTAGSAAIYLQADGNGNVVSDLPSGSYTVVGYWPEGQAFVQTNTALSSPGTAAVTVQPAQVQPLQITINGVAPTQSVDVLLQNAQLEDAWYATNAAGKLTGVPDGAYTLLEVADQSSTYQPSSATTVIFTGGQPSIQTVDVK